MINTENSRPNIESILPLRNRALQESYQWALENIIPEIWYSSKWKKCAKGGANVLFSNHLDMTYGMHYLTGISTALKVIDFSISNGDFPTPERTEDFIVELKRGLFCYLFHDYNKVSDDSYHMNNCEQNVRKLLQGSSLDKLMTHLELDDEDICSSAYMTEVGTSSKIFSQTRIGKKDMSFQYNFSTLADSLSSRYLSSSKSSDMKFGGKSLIKSRDIEKIGFQYTHLFALTGLLRDSLRKYLKTTERFFLWDLPNSMLFVGSKLEPTEYENISRMMKERLSQEMTLQRTMEMNDRTMGMEAASVFPPIKEDLDSFILKRFSDIMHLPSGEIKDKEKEIYENYSREVVDISLEGFNVNCFGKKKYRDCLLIDELEEITDDMRAAFVIRFLQLNISDINKVSRGNPSFKPLNEAFSKISNLSNKYSEKYGKILGKNPQKSTFLIPLIISDFKNSISILYPLILDFMGRNIADSPDFTEIVKSILTGDLQKLENVPEKRQMSIISGGPAHTIAKKSNLYGVNTQTFSNRLVPSISLSSGKIDRISSIDNLLRKSILKNRDSSAIMFARIPGPVPIVSTRELIKTYARKEDHSKLSNLSSPNELTVGSLEITPQVDNSFMLSVGDMRSDADAIRVLKLVIDFADITQMKVLVTYANSPVFGNQRESVRFEIHNSILASLGYDRLRCDEILPVKKELYVFTGVAASFYANFSVSKTANVMREFSRNPLSIFQFKSDSKNAGKKEDFILKKFKEICEMIEKRGKSMKNLEILAERAAEIARVSPNDSNNTKTRLLRTGLDAFEKARATLSNGRDYTLEDIEEFCAGPIWSGIERDDKFAKNKDIIKVQSFVKALVKMLNDDFNGKIPSGNAKSYLISAFEYMYIIKSKEMKKNEE